MQKYTTNLSPGDDECRRHSVRLLTKEELHRYSQPSDGKFLLAFAIDLATLALTIWISEAFWSPPLYIVAVFIIGSRLHAMAVLMHEATHYRAMKNRTWNDIMGEIAALSTPLTLLGYRKNHFVHHREINSDDDPDWQRTRNSDYDFPKKRSELLWLLVKHTVGATLPRELKTLAKEKYVNDIPAGLKAFRAVFALGLIGAGIAFGFWKQVLLYYFVPMFTSLLLFLYIRSLAEHYSNLEYEHALNHTRTVVAPFWERWLFARHATNYHIVHHLNPSVPFFRLKELHRYLMTKPEYAQKAHVTHGYIRGLLMDECCVEGNSSKRP